MRLLYGGCGLGAQAVLRWMRTRLRSLSQAEWEPFFGQAAEWKAKYHASQAELHRQRAEKHEMGQRTTEWQGKAQGLYRLLKRNGVDVPDALRAEPQP